MVDGEALERMVSHSVSERRMKAGSRGEMQKMLESFQGTSEAPVSGFTRAERNGTVN
jgi:hypothetical protein